MADIRIFPYISTPRGIEVCYSINGGAIQQKRFPPGTSRAAIVADLEGHPLQPTDHGAETAAKNAEVKAQRAAVSQPAHTATEGDLKQQDFAKDALIAELNMMRAALKEAGVKGYQLLQEPALRRKYAELREQQAGKGE